MQWRGHLVLGNVLLFYQSLKCVFFPRQLCFETAGGHLIQLPAGLSPELDTAAQDPQLCLVPHFWAFLGSALNKMCSLLPSTWVVGNWRNKQEKTDVPCSLSSLLARLLWLKYRNSTVQECSIAQHGFGRSVSCLWAVLLLCISQKGMARRAGMLLHLHCGQMQVVSS